MSSRSRSFPNPFYVLLLVVSTAFVVSIFAYLIAPTVLDQAPAAAGAVPERAGSLRLADWLLHYSPTVLTVEIIIMAMAAALAMATDHFFAPKRS